MKIIKIIMSEENQNSPEHRDEVFNQALEYLRRGFSVIPVGRDKKPLLKSWSEFQKRRPTEEDLSWWWFELEPAGVAIITGAISGIVVLDCEKGADLSGLNAPKTPSAKTGGGGLHYYFKHPGKNVQNATRIKPLMDIRGDGGYVVAPPSLHLSGGRYEWLDGLDTPLADMPDWMDSENKTSSPKNSASTPVKNDWDEITSGVEEGRRHDAAVKIVGKLLAHIPRKDRDSFVLPMLEAWNEKNTPPLPDNELWDIYDGIRERHEQSEATNEPMTRERKLLSVADLLSYKPASYPFLVDKLVPHRGITALSGHPEAGKSWVMLEIAKSVASGTALFGKFKTLKGNVLVVDEESGIDEFWKRARMLGYSEDLSIFFHIQCGFKLDNEKDLAQLLSTVRKNEISLIIFDPYVSMHNKSENSAEETAVVMQALQKFNETGAAVIYVHHLRKDSIMKFGGAQSLRGSSALLGRLDSLIRVHKVTSDEVSDEIQILHEKSRRGKKEPEFQISMIEENGKIFFDDIIEVEPAKRKLEQATEAITNMFDDDTELTRVDIITAVKNVAGVGEKNVADAIRKLVKDQVLVEIRRGREKHYKLALNKGSEAVI